MSEPRKGLFLVSDSVRGNDFFVVMDGHTKILAFVYINERIGIGVSRCRPEDKYNEEVGIYLAQVRAIKNICTQIENVWMSRTKTKEEVIAQREQKRQLKA